MKINFFALQANKAIAPQRDGTELADKPSADWPLRHGRVALGINDFMSADRVGRNTQHGGFGRVPRG